MNEDVKMYIPYGAAALGGFVGNWLFNKYPKFGMVGKLVAIAGGVAGGYYISKSIMGEKVEMPFKNAVDRLDCNKQCPFTGGTWDKLTKKCKCNTPVPSRWPVTEELFSNAVKDTPAKRRRCRLHSKGRIVCMDGTYWDENDCACKIGDKP